MRAGFPLPLFLLLPFADPVPRSQRQARAQVRQAPTATTRKPIERVLRTQQEAWNRHDLEGFMAGYWHSPQLTFFSEGKEQDGWQATMERYLAKYASPGHEMGKLEFSEPAHRSAEPGCGLCARRVEVDDVRRQNAAWIVHAGVPQVPRGDGRSCTTTRRLAGVIASELLSFYAARPMPLSMASLARRSASAIVFAESVADREPFQLRDQFLGAAVKILQRRVLHLVNAFDLAHQQLGIADQLQGFRTMLEGVFESCNQALILGEVVGLVAEVFAEMGDFSSRLILDYDAITGRAGIAARAAVAVSDEVVLGRIFAV